MTFALQDAPLVTLTASDVAFLLRMTEEQFLRKARVMTRDHAFPRHLPGVTRRWSRNQVLSWINNGGMLLIATPQSPAEVADLVTQAQAELNKRYGAGR
jgi:hypothetical protein